MARILIRHNDDPDEMEATARSIFGESASLSSVDGNHGEIELYVERDNLTPHALADFERMEFVISAEMA
ncbi:hypothetical protein HGA34_04510 [Candidatus Falkowbacteria bacterium]|nr:hypothetical protein [Candidatus Falkowbacteria bacterium]